MKREARAYAPTTVRAKEMRVLPTDDAWQVLGEIAALITDRLEKRAKAKPPTQESHPDPVEVPTLIDALTLASMMQVSTWTLYRMVREGKFPKPQRLRGRKSNRWLTSDYVAWLKAHSDA